MRYRLLLDSSDGSLATLEVPAGVSYLTRNLALAKRRPRKKTPLIVLEEIQRDGGTALLAFCPSEERVRLNGAPAPVVAALRVKDQLQLDGDKVLHVTAYHPGLQEKAPRPAVTCPVCRTPVENGPVYACPCGAVLHCDDTLECARLGSCPSCHQPVRLEEGLVYEPET